MDTKPCRDCGVTKLLTDFYKHPQMTDGYLNSCKDCRKTYVKKNYADKLPEKRAYEKKRNATPERKASLYQGVVRHRKLHPDRYKARRAVSNAIRDGRLVRGPCERCGWVGKTHGHHDDYSKPLDVRWLCFRCHIGHEHGNILEERSEVPSAASKE